VEFKDVFFFTRR